MDALSFRYWTSSHNEDPRNKKYVLRILGNRSKIINEYYPVTYTTGQRVDVKA